ncbi:uncharacterized protein EV422DRAFT_546027 [Fimicolochytrium jonesii]|uniref:uncharacterized protein n=1 Tax=Fimicolochytrium jonesii TaxID=1396493 RepID=UPI0022FF2AB3|nr:uncharacterized protein EV422DRAFT_546027 [Fimicolochytrium jonesii]KAI8816445.1 hypothetical protein EV422DRAFT_546027 [Fimicolochytrium jonesii]
MPLTRHIPRSTRPLTRLHSTTTAAAALPLPTTLTSHFAALTAPAQTVSTSPTLTSLTGAALGWLSGMLWAVPKKKTTHRKKRMRMATKWLKPLRNISSCPFCGQPTLIHHLCRTCTKEVLKE